MSAVNESVVAIISNNQGDLLSPRKWIRREFPAASKQEET